MIEDLCQLLPWDTELFGCRIGRVIGNTLTLEKIDLIDKFCQIEGIRCLYFLATLEDPNTTHVAEEHGFHYVDTRITFECNLPILPKHRSNLVVRFATLEDVPILMSIAGKSYTASRFFFDSNFSRDLCARLYETWIKVSCETTYAQAVFVAEVDGLPAGYITCHVDQSPNIGRIGLVGVSEKCQGHGLGKLLVHHALEWFGNQGLPLSMVDTQGRNLNAQRLYQRCGFVTQCVRLWYHKWYPSMDK